jgi:hypothetical protein
MGEEAEVEKRALVRFAFTALLDKRVTPREVSIVLGRDWLRGIAAWDLLRGKERDPSAPMVVGVGRPLLVGKNAKDREYANFIGNTDNAELVIE